MLNADDNAQHFEVIIYNDKTTPFEFVAGLISHLTGLPLYYSEEAARRISHTGKHALGPYPESIAQVIYQEAKQAIESAGHPLFIETMNIAHSEQSAVVSCSFCGKPSTAVDRLLAGQNGSICDECITSSAAVLQNLLSTARVSYTYQLLDWHFGKVSPETFVKTNHVYPGRVRADLQIAINEIFNANAIRIVGIKQQYGYEKIDLTDLWTSVRNAHGLAPISFEELDIGEPEPIKCQLNGLWLLQDNGDRYAAVLSREKDYGGNFTIYLEISGPQGERTAEITRNIFSKIEEQIKAAQSYRGKVLSLEQAPHYGGSSTGITVHKMQTVNRREIILPEQIIEKLDRTIVRFCANRERLRALGLQTKRGVLFYGPPGTGKTHTIRYLASMLKDHTTFLVTAEQIGLLPEYFALARLMQPVIFVIEDADLLAKARSSMHSPGEEVLLNHMLNEMDGLKEDADILFVLSTNKPEALEEALVARPGRIDQLIEFPRPDEDCRIRLMKLYGNALTINPELEKNIAKRTEGVSASFLKELMRRLAQYSIDRGEDGIIAKTDVDQALEEMLFANNLLNRAILGGANVSDIEQF
ncbi:MAG: cell division protein FtsH [Methylobacter sp.]|nr:MAG: cell division protein FtsH [Methylobacter sp.]PPD02609.1 MAG: cell division protein FtsH [Methylobacter sp.]